MTLPPPERTNWPGENPPADPFIDVPSLIRDGAESRYRSAYKEGWKASARAYYTSDEAYAELIMGRIKYQSEYGGGGKYDADGKYGKKDAIDATDEDDPNDKASRTARAAAEAVDLAVAYAQSVIRGHESPRRKNDLLKNLAVELRNAANRIDPNRD